MAASLPNFSNFSWNILQANDKLESAYCRWDSKSELNFCRPWGFDSETKRLRIFQDFCILKSNTLRRPQICLISWILEDQDTIGVNLFFWDEIAFFGHAYEIIRIIQKWIISDGIHFFRNISIKRGFRKEITIKKYRAGNSMNSMTMTCDKFNYLDNKSGRTKRKSDLNH